VSAGVEVDGCLQVKLCDDIVFTGCGGLGEWRDVRVVDVGLVVVGAVGVVEGHDLGHDVGLEGLVNAEISVFLKCEGRAHIMCVGQIWKGVFCWCCHLGVVECCDDNETRDM
jgi:hypothetical protein